jgi:TolB-like protein/class 3 adenylate cyclase
MNKAPQTRQHASSARRLVAIMFTDIVGYTAMMGDEEEKAFILLDKNRALQKPLIEAYGGKWIKELGDGVLATFSTISDAVYCAAAIQQGSKNEPELNLRIGIHQGEVIFQDGDVFGDGVNIASRIEALAPSGEIWVSEPVGRNIQNKHGIEAEFVREEQLKNVKDPVKIYAIKVADIELPASGGHPLMAETEKLKPLSKKIYYALASFILAIALYWAYTKFYGSPTVEEDVTIAVLAFDDQSPNGDQQWLGDGMADEILNVLANVEGLQVTGKTSSFSFKGKELTTKVIGKTLNVKTILEGSVSKIGGKLRITAQLIDVETDTHIWSKKYDREATDIFNIMDEVAQSIASSLKSELSPQQLKEIKVSYEVDPEAYEYYLKGVYLHWGNFAISGKNATIGGKKIYFAQSEKMFMKAISIDPVYAEAYAGLADLYDTYANLFDNTRYDLKRDSVINTGYKINSNSAYILAIKGLAYTDIHRTFNLDSAFYFLERTYLIDSTNTIINNIIAEVFGEIGLHDKAIAIISKMLLLDPLNIYVRNQLAKFLIRNGSLEKGREECLKILEIDDTNLSANSWLFILATYNKDRAEAERINEKLQQISPNGVELLRAWLLAYDGKKKEALSLNKGILTYSLLDMKEEALSLVDSLSRQSKYTGLWTYNNLKNVKVFEFIWDKPAYKEVLARSKKVHAERLAKYGHLFEEK